MLEAAVIATHSAAVFHRIATSRADHYIR
jgi:hypothetical protein